MIHGVIHGMERKFGRDRSATSRSGLDREDAAEAANTLFHAENAHAALASGIKTIAIVRDFHGDFIGVLNDRDFRVLCGSVRGGVIQSFLHEAVDTDFGIVAKIFGDALRVNFDFHIAAAGNFTSLPFEGGDQAQVIQHGRTQKKSDIANGFDGIFGDGFYVRDLRVRGAVFGRDELRELADFDEERAERLADFIVQFARDGTALFFLSFDETRGQTFELETAARQRLIALAALALETQDVPAADERHEDAGNQSERDEPNKPRFHGLKPDGERQIFVGETFAVHGRDLLRNFEDVRAPRQKFFSDELLSVLLSIAGTPSECGGDGILLVHKKSLHFLEQILLFRKLVGRKTKERGAYFSNLFCNVAGIGTGSGELILEKIALDLIVVDANGNDDSRESLAARRKAAADLLFDRIQLTQGDKRVEARADQESEQPAERYEQESANFARVFLGLRIGLRVWAVGRRDGILVFNRGAHLLRINQNRERGDLKRTKGKRCKKVNPRAAGRDPWEMVRVSVSSAPFESHAIARRN